MAAGRVIGVILLGLVGGLFLNAGDILDTAERQELGWQRTVGLAIMEPIATASNALLLDRPRAIIDTALGRPTSGSGRQRRTYRIREKRSAFASVPLLHRMLATRDS